jgi:hypothetical protein
MKRFTNEGELWFALTSMTTIIDGLRLLITVIKFSKQLGLDTIVLNIRSAKMITASSSSVSNNSSLTCFMSDNRTDLNEKGKFKDSTTLANLLPEEIDHKAMEILIAE